MYIYILYTLRETFPIQGTILRSIRLHYQMETIDIESHQCNPVEEGVSHMAFLTVHAQSSSGRSQEQLVAQGLTDLKEAHKQELAVAASVDIEAGRSSTVIEISVKEPVTVTRNNWFIMIGICIMILWICSTWALIYNFAVGLPENDSIEIRPFETTASFEYHGEDIVHDNMFTLVHDSSVSLTGQEGCISFKETSGKSKQIFLTDSFRIQTMRFHTKDLRIPQSVTINTCHDVFATIYSKGKPILSVFSGAEKDLSMYNFDEIAITYVKNHVYSDRSQILLEVEGPVNTLDPCVKFSNVAPETRVGVSNLLICGRTGENSVSLNEERLAEVGIDLRKLSNDFPYVTTGGLSSMTMHSFDGVKKSTLPFSSNEFKNLNQHHYQESSGIYKSWSSGVQGFVVSYQ